MQCWRLFISNRKLFMAYTKTTIQPGAISFFTVALTALLSEKCCTCIPSFNDQHRWVDQGIFTKVTKNENYRKQSNAQVKKKRDLFVYWFWIDSVFLNQLSFNNAFKKSYFHSFIYIYIYIYSWLFLLIYISKNNKLGDRRRRWPKGSLFNSYYTKLSGRAQPLSLNCSTLPLIRTL